MTPEEKAAQEEADRELAEDLGDIVSDLTPDLPASEEESEDEESEEESEESEEEEEDKEDVKNVEEDKDDSEEEAGEEDSKAKAEEDETPAKEVEEGEEGEEEEAPIEEEEPLTEREKKLMARVEELSGMIAAPTPKAKPKKELESKPEELQPKSADETQQVVDSFLGDLKLDDVLEDPDLFNKVLLNLATHVQNTTTEQVLRSVPELVTRFVQSNSALKEMADDFYKANPDLAGVKNTVAHCANEVYSDDPSLTTEELFKKAGEKARSVLSMPALKKDETVKRGGKKPKPAFAKGSKGGKRAEKAPELTELEKDIVELMED